MTEQIKRRRPEAEPFGVGGPGDAFADQVETDRTATVSHGPYLERLPVANMSVREIRARFGDRLDIAPQSQAVIDGQEVGEDTIVQTGEHITFVRKAGEKGRLNCKPAEAIR
jgi:hypothetical protein